MPTEDFSSKIGHSPSPAIERVIENNTNVQQPYPSTDAALADKHTRHPVTDIDKKQ
jgi:hypothetical protein